MYEAFDAGSDFNKCAVVGHDNNLTVNFVADFEVGVKGIPWVGLELFQAESDALAFVVEVEDNNVELLVELDNFFGVAYAAPRKVGDVDKAVNAAEVDEYTV